ncbi:MAG: GDYXXLXY domain-containing protein [Pseudomonadota bacterium]
MKAIGLKFGLGLLIVGLLQTAALAWMVYDRVSLLQTGTEIVLKTVPVDPRSLFRGHYVILNYEVSTLDLDGLDGGNTFRRGDKIDVFVRPDDAGNWTPVKVSTATGVPEVLDGTVRLRGKVRYCRRSKTQKKLCSEVAVRYGAEKYFVYKERALELERSRNKRRLRIILAVSDDGQAAVKGIEDNGRRIYNEPLF